jgi:hypothetical protein
MTFDQGLRELALPARDLEPVRLELLPARVVLAQSLPLADKQAQCLLEALNALRVAYT